jgi:hypothetical protein
MAAAPKHVTIHRCPKGAIVLETESMSGKGRASWYAQIPSEHGIEDVLRPEYFGLMQSETQMGKVLRAGDLIDIEPENARWRLQVRVMGLRFRTQQVILREAQRWDFSVKEPPGFRFVWNGTQAGWEIYKGDTLVDSGFTTEDECLARVEELRREKAA